MPIIPFWSVPPLIPPSPLHLQPRFPSIVPVTPLIPTSPLHFQSTIHQPPVDSSSAAPVPPLIPSSASSVEIASAADAATMAARARSRTFLGCPSCTARGARSGTPLQPALVSGAATHVRLVHVTATVAALCARRLPRRSAVRPLPSSPSWGSRGPSGQGRLVASGRK